MDKKALLAIAGASILSVAATTATAHEEGDLILRAGVAVVDPQNDSTGTLDALNSSVDSDAQLGLTATYMFTDNLGVGVLAATPFKHDIKSNGTVIGDTKHLPPTVTLQYFPMDNSSKFQPYVGVGVNYTTFFSESSVLGDLKIDDSVGLAAQIGMDYKISENLYLNATAWYLDIDADAELNGVDIGTANLEPWVYMVGAGWKF